MVENKVLLISTCMNKFHENEFVRPVFDIVNSITEKIEIIHYKKLDTKNIDKSQKIIICGTALKDFEYLDNVDKFSWIKNFNGSLLGICAGSQIIGKVFGAGLNPGCEIGMVKLEVVKDDELFDGVKLDEVYCLHNSYSKVPSGFELIAKSEYPQVFKKKDKKMYGVLFHGEVRNKKLIENFVNL